MLKKVQKMMQEQNMVSPGEKLLVGVSGGADSVCLLLVLETLRQEMGFDLEVVHVEHGIRGQESLEDADFVADLCRRVGVSFHMKSVDVPAYCEKTGLGTEEGARILRYQEFAGLAKVLNAKVALAHHMEDNVETVLFQMVRGSALTGLCGMQTVREDAQGVHYIRPLLGVHRKEIEQFLQSHGMGYRVDATNEQLDYSRNYIRNVVVPNLQNINEQAVEHIHASAVKLSEVRGFLQEEVEKAWKQVVLNRDDAIELDIPKLREYHIVLQKEIIYKAIAETTGGKKDISSVHVNDVLQVCGKQSGKMVILPNGLIAKKEYEILRIYKEIEACVGANDTILELTEQDLQKFFQTTDSQWIPIGNKDEKIIVRCFRKEENNQEIPQKTYTKWFDYDKIKNGFCIRTRISGDYFIGDAFGHRKKLKEYFIGEKIPLAKRDKMWLLAQENHVLWLIGGRISECVKVTEDTKNIIEITYDGGK